MRLGIDERTIRRTLAALALGAVVLRVLMFFGRGDYVAFDEGWYLLLGQSLWRGDGYRLTGLRHTTLSPLFPVLAGGLGRLLGDPVWAGRIVAAVTSGLLVVPCWFIFRRLAGRRTALLGCVLVAVMPSLAPFVAPEWVGWDLWVGAEPVYHLFLFSGIALALRAVDRQRTRDWLAAGAALSLAYLARPEAVVVAGLLGLGIVGTAWARRTPRLALGGAMAGLAFAVVALPYWTYLRSVTGRWTLTGRAVQIRPAEREGPSATSIIEGMLWQGRQSAYVRNLFSLDPSGARMASSYWGVPDTPAMPAETPAAVGGGVVDTADVADATDAIAVTEAAGAAGAADATDAAYAADAAYATDTADAIDAATREIAAGPAAQQSSARKNTTDSAAASSAPPPGSSRTSLYFRALGKIVPAVVWPFLLVGALAPRRSLRMAEPLFAVPLAATSLLIAAVIAIDPRTQLFVVPVLALFAARGSRWLGVLFDVHAPAGAIRKGLVPALLVVFIVGALTTEDVRRLYLSRSMETTHQLLAAENRRAGEVLRGIVPEGKTVMSWHPAVALHARREWRVLPMASLPAIIRYAGASGADYVVFSDFYPSPIPAERAPGAYLVVHVPPAAASAEAWRIQVTGVRGNVAISELIPNPT
ncbi:MAG TPA: glycosyltransferase family 39 protein [Longimicrobiales bacterium]